MIWFKERTEEFDEIQPLEAFPLLGLDSEIEIEAVYIDDDSLFVLHIVKIKKTHLHLMGQPQYFSTEGGFMYANVRKYFQSATLRVTICKNCSKDSLLNKKSGNLTAA